MKWVCVSGWCLCEVGCFSSLWAFLTSASVVTSLHLVTSTDPWNERGEADLRTFEQGA
jgi:hypothetical protein